VKGPSIVLTIVFYLVYLLGEIPIIVGLAYVSRWCNLPPDIATQYLSQSIWFIRIVLTISLIFFLARNYSAYLLTKDWKANLFAFSLKGLKWSLLLVLFYAVTLSFPSTRSNLLEYYHSTNIISSQSIKPVLFFLFAIFVLLGAIFEEFVFRGIVLQKLQKLLGQNLSVIISAVLFGFAHLTVFGFSIAKLLNAVLVGLFCGFAFKETRSCISAFVPHLVNNGIFIAVLGLIRLNL